MKYELAYTKKAVTDLKMIAQVDAKRILKKLSFFIEQTDPISFAKPLKGIFKGLFRFRVGDYRAIFSKDSNGNLVVLSIVTIKHRREVYED